MSEYQRLKQLLARYERQEDEGDMYTEAGISSELDEDSIEPEEEAFMIGYLSA